ncbi:MAG: hypothetical protein AB7M12_02835 [Hyphomonadaceae bacterium]
MRNILMAAASIAVLVAAPSAFADKAKKDVNAAAAAPAAADSMPAAPAASGAMTSATVNINTLTPKQLPAGAAIVAQDNVPLGALTSVYVDQGGKVSSVLITPAGATAGKKIPASQVTLADGKLVVAMSKAAFDALPAAS